MRTRPCLGHTGGMLYQLATAIMHHYPPAQRRNAAAWLAEEYDVNAAALLVALNLEMPPAGLEKARRRYETSRASDTTQEREAEVHYALFPEDRP